MQKTRMYKKFFEVLYGCDTWSLTLSREHILQVSENKELRKIFGDKIGRISHQFRTSRI